MSVLGKKILKLFNSPKRRKKSNASLVPFEQSSSIGIIYTWVDQKKEEALEALVQQIGPNKKIEILCFNPSESAISTENASFDMTALTNFGKLNSEAVHNFIQEPFDYLFHFDLESEELVKSILVQTKARCRIGIHDEFNTDYYELMIGINKSAGISNFAKQMIKYVSSIR